MSTDLLSSWTAGSIPYAIMTTAQQMLQRYIDAETAVLSGQSVRLGERQLTRADLAEIRAGRREWQQQVDRESPQRSRNPRWANIDFGGTT